MASEIAEFQVQILLGYYCLPVDMAHRLRWLYLVLWVLLNYRKIWDPVSWVRFLSLVEYDLESFGGTRVCRNTYTCSLMLKFAVFCDMAAVSFTAVARSLCVLAAHESVVSVQTLLCMPV